VIGEGWKSEADQVEAVSRQALVVEIAAIFPGLQLVRKMNSCWLLYVHSTHQKDAFYSVVKNIIHSLVE
jgi:hypothetical protein